jgi:neutral ceramidase
MTTVGDLIGWGSRATHCTGVNDPLVINSLVVESNASRIALITADLLAVDFTEADAIRRRMPHVGIQPENVLIAASHTHSGPASIDICSIQKNKELATELVEKAEQCVGEALKSLAPASTRTAFTEYFENANRRQRTWLGRTGLGVNLKGPVDHQVSCIMIENLNGKFLLLTYGCHPVINATSLESADYIAGIREAAVSIGFAGSVFLAGALGDVNPYDRQRHRPLVGAGPDTALDFGRKLAKGALNRLTLAEEDTPPIVASASRNLNVSLPRIGGGEVNRDIVIQAIRIGGLTLIAFPGEIFAQTSLDLKRKLAMSNLAIVSCANGYMGYVSPRAEYARGGYEIEEVPRLLGYAVPSGLAETFSGIAEELLASLARN